MTDQTFANLLHRLAAQPTQPIPPGVKEEINMYYADMSQPFITKKKPEQWAALQKDLQTLQTMPTAKADVVFATYGDDAGEQ